MKSLLNLLKKKKKNTIIEVHTPLVTIVNDVITENDMKTLPIASECNCYYNGYWNQDIDNILLNIIESNNNNIHWGKVASELNKLNKFNSKIFFAKECKDRYYLLLNNNYIPICYY